MSPARNIKVSAAGPIAGLALAALVYFALLAFSNNPLVFLSDDNSPRAYAIFMMLFFGVFGNVLNLLPCLPLDGGHITEGLLDLYGPRRRNRMELVLQISIVAAGLVAIRSALCLNSEMPVLPYWLFKWLPDPHRTIFANLQPDPKSLMIFFGILCALNVNNLNKLKTWR